jgi:hypothetical protein
MLSLPQHSLSRDQLHELVDVSGDLLADNNHKVAQATLVLLATLVNRDTDAIKPYIHILIPSVVRGLRCWARSCVGNY